MADETSDDLTIEELARQVDMTVRNLREYQSLGLLEPPQRRGRTGYYGAAHVARVQRVQALQADGFPLDLIRRMLSSADDEGVIAFTRALKAPFQDEPSQAIDAAELARRFDIHSTDALGSAIALGLVRARDDGSLEIVSPRLLRTGETMAELGLTGDELLEVTAAVRQHIDSVTEIFARIYRDYVWEPFDRAGRPSDGWAEIRAVLERLRPLALDTVVATFKLSMDSTVARVLGEEIVSLLNSGQPDPAQWAD